MLHKASRQAFVLFTIMINWPFSPCRAEIRRRDEESCPCQWNKGEKFLIGTFIVYYGSRKVFGFSRSTLAFKYIFMFGLWGWFSDVIFALCCDIRYGFFVFSLFFWMTVEKQKQDFLCALRCEFTPDSNLNNRNREALLERHGIRQNVMRLQGITLIHPHMLKW